jgi:ubiquinone biosynthesis protein UbiJ
MRAVRVLEGAEQLTRANVGLRHIAELASTPVTDLVHTEDSAPVHAAELAAFKAELAETRALVDQVVQKLERLTQPRSSSA